jgi:pyridoxal phosphate-dependent aminotransferase EpsN
VDRLYLSPPHVGALERELLLDAFDSNWIAPLGPHVDAFEQEFAAFVGAENAVALSSGTAALHLALTVLGVQAGDEVLMPSLTFAATANAAAYLGARPVFVDSERVTWNVDPALVAEELSERGRTGHQVAAVIGVDLYGQCADWEPLTETCREYGVPVIEDAAEALGATSRGQAAGTLGEIGAFSFNGNKIMTTSGGGMLVAHDAGVVDHVRFLSTQARDPAPHYEHSEIGFNYRMSNLLAALGRGQLVGLPERIERRRAINHLYRDAFADDDGIEFLPDAALGRPTNWLTVITIDEPAFGASPSCVREELEHENIEARPAWKPMHLQPVFRNAPMRGGAVAEEIFRTGLCLPSGSAMTDGDVERVVRAVHGARGQRRSA